MSSDTVDRKIAVILATDVVGYSKHMETNEIETVQNLKVCEQILTKTFKKHKGRLATSEEVKQLIRNKFSGKGIDRGVQWVAVED